MNRVGGYNVIIKLIMQEIRMFWKCRVQYQTVLLFFCKDIQTSLKKSCIWIIIWLLNITSMFSASWTRQIAQIFVSKVI